MNSTRNTESSRIHAELAALGEPEPDAIELPTAQAPAQDADVAVVLSIFGLAHGAGPELTPLERRRVWRRLETLHPRGAQQDAPEPAGKRGSGLWVGLAAAAALVLVPLFAPEQVKRTSDPDAQAMVLAVSQQARRSLAEMPGGQDGTRARALADDYAARLHGTAGGAGGGDR